MHRLILSTFIALASVAAYAQANTQLDPAGPSDTPPAIAMDPGFAGQFRCPESYPDEDSRLAATERYLAWASRAHPDWRVDDTLNYRSTLLRANRCNVALDSEVGNAPHSAR